MVVTNSRESVARLLRREVATQVRLYFSPDGRTIEIEAKNPRRASGPYLFWRRAVISVTKGGSPYELKILGMVLKDVMDLVETA